MHSPRIPWESEAAAAHLSPASLLSIRHLFLKETP